jgi:hypothetical protein
MLIYFKDFDAIVNENYDINYSRICNRNLLVKWINSHQHHTCVYMGTVLFPFSYIIEQSKASNSASQSSPTHVFLFSFVTHGEYREVLHFPILTQ